LNLRNGMRENKYYTIIIEYRKYGNNADEKYSITITITIIY